MIKIINIDRSRSLCYNAAVLKKVVKRHALKLFGNEELEHG